MVDDQGETVVTQDAASDSPVHREAPETRYTVESEISRGGLGRVMRGHDHNLDRVVAIKQLVMHNARFEQRFQREARITARLQHPGVVPIYETGQLPSGEPFYAMKLVSGHTLGEELSRATTLDDRLAVIPKLIAMCDAVAYAHSERVIHRDLKPDNVMVGPFGEVLVVDWGLAKDLAVADQPDPPPLDSPVGKPGLTVEGAVLGTPPYLAPEQARGEPVDARADVYSLGAILYQALAGIPPHVTAKPKKAATSTPITEEPPTASVHARGSADGDVLIQRLRAGEPTLLREHEPGAPRELVAIVEQAMARDPADRYPDAAALVADLRRFQTGQLVAAHSYSRGMLIRRWLQRRRAMVTASLVAVVAITVVAMVSVSRIVDERDRAREAEQQATTASAIARRETVAKELRANELVLAQARHWLDLEPTTTLGWLKQYAQGPSADASEIRALAVDAVGRGAALDLVRGLFAVELAEDGTVVGYDAQTRVALWNPGQQIRAITPPLDKFRPVAIKLNGTAIAWIGTAIQLYERGAGSSRVLAPFHKGHAPTAMTFLGDALALGEEDGIVRIVDLHDGSERVLGVQPGKITDLVASHDETMLASSSNEPSVRLWTVATGGVRELAAESLVLVMVFSPRSDRFAWGGVKMPIHWVDVARPVIHQLPKMPGPGTSALAFSPDGHTIAVGAEADDGRIVDLITGAIRMFPKGHTDWINALAYTSDGRILVSAQSHGGPIFAWDLVTGDRRSLIGHNTTLTLLRVGRDGVVLTADRSPQIRRWSVPPARERVFERNIGHLPIFTALPSGGFVTARNTYPVHWSDLDTPPRGPKLANTVATSLSATPRGDQIAFGDTGGGVWMWNLATDALIKVDHADVDEIAMSPSGELLGVGCNDGSVRIVGLGDHPTVKVLGKHASEVNDIAFSPDGAHLATTSQDRQVMIWDLANGKPRAFSHNGMAIGGIAFSPDGTLAVGYDQGLVDLIAPDGSVRTLRGHEGEVTQLVFVDKATLATGSDDGSIRVWEITTGNSRLMHHRGHVIALAVLPGGRLASGNAIEQGGDATIRIWDLATTQLVSEWHGHARAVIRLVLLADGKTLASVGTDETIRTWQLDPAAPLPNPDLAWLTTLSSVVLDAKDIVASPVHE